MTRYTYYQLIIEKLEQKAAATNDGRLRTFYSNAVRGFKQKQLALALTLAQANGIIIG
ncbi:MAG: hypothetical protein MJ196_06030 [Treponemataceae bacterium]|nr:hypothetical protein [Treponemataceae bacterium]